MSLKAKIEAVIYASEDPVTLPQLIGLLGEEAQGELDARDAEQATLELVPAFDDQDLRDDEDALNAETLSEPEPAEEQAPEASTPDEPAAEADITPVEATPENIDALAAEAAVTKEKSAAALVAEGKARERKLRAYFREVLDELMADYLNGDRGIEVREVAGGFRLATKPEYHDAVRGFVKHLKPPLKLSLPALETLAVIAYKQPVTAPEIAEIRGVDAGGVLGSLLSRKLIATAGRKQVIGRPMLYKTSKDFLVRFGLKDINELPSIEEFERMASELNEAVQEEIPMDRESTEDQDSPSIAETDSAPQPAHPVHESADDILADKEVANDDGTKREASPSAEASAEVEPMADVHEPQADGEPETE